MMMLRDNPGANKKPRRVGRGHSSGWGKTSARGHKGQKSRAGASIGGFEGGQMPFYRRLPKSLGFKSHRPDYAPLDLKRLENLLFHGKIVEKENLTYQRLLDLGLISKRQQVKILGNTVLSQVISIEAHAASASAKEALEKAGVKITFIEKTIPADNSELPGDNV